MKLRLFLMISVLALAALACQAITSSDESNAPAGEQAAPSGSQGEQATSTPNVLFRDDFSDPASGWDRVNVTEGVTDYADGSYRIYVNTGNTDVWANPGLNFGDARIEVEATKVGGSDNNDFGLVCRYQDSENFYFFVISSDGYYGVGKVMDGVQDLIGVESMPTSNVILKGNETNRLSAECVGSTLRMFINDVQVAEYADSSFGSGDVGLIAGSFDESGTDVYFDNFVVYEP